MDADLLLCDIGNTSIKIGLANKESVLMPFSLPVQNEDTADSLGLTLISLLTHAKVQPGQIRACVADSVVPAKDPVLARAVARYIGCPLYFVPRDLNIPLENRYARPAEVGADRLVGAYAARKAYPDCPSLIVVDYGTAVTFDCVENQAYLGGLIFPGPQTAMFSLARHTAKLPTVNLDIRAADPVIDRDTATSIRDGLVFGFAGATESICARLKRQLAPPVKIIATGGFAASMARLTTVFDVVMPVLLLEGLRGLYFEENPK